MGTFYTFHSCAQYDSTEDQNHKRGSFHVNGWMFVDQESKQTNGPILRLSYNRPCVRVTRACGGPNSDFRWPQAIAGNRGHGRTHLFASTWSLQCTYAWCAGCDFWEAATVPCPVHDLRVKCWAGEWLVPVPCSTCKCHVRVCDARGTLTCNAQVTHYVCACAVRPRRTSQGRMRFTWK